MNTEIDSNRLAEMIQEIENADESLKESQKAALDADKKELQVHNAFKQVPERFSHITRLEKAAFSVKQKHQNSHEKLEDYFESDWYENKHQDMGPKKSHWDVLYEAYQLRGEMIDHLMVLGQMSKKTAEQLFALVEYQEKLHDADKVVKQVEKISEYYEKFVDKQAEMMEKMSEQNREIQDLERKVSRKDERIAELERKLDDAQAE